MSLEEIKEEALKLPLEEREILAEKLYASIHSDDLERNSELKALFDRRWEEIVSGKVKTLSREEVQASVRETLKQVCEERQVPS